MSSPSTPTPAAAKPASTPSTAAAGGSSPASSAAPADAVRGAVRNVMQSVDQTKSNVALSTRQAKIFWNDQIAKPFNQQARGQHEATRRRAGNVVEPPSPCIANSSLNRITVPLLAFLSQSRASSSRRSAATTRVR